MPKKEKKPIDLKNYLKQIERATGKRDKIKEVLDDDKNFKKYLISLGMNPEWTELPAVLEIIKNRFSRALKRRQPNFRARINELVLGKGEITDKKDVVPNKITQDEFELGEGEKFVYSAEDNMIHYIKTERKSSFEKREIDPKSGVVIRQIKRFGGNAIDENSDSYYSLIEYTRDPNEPKVHYRTVYKNNHRENNEIDESKVDEYDYGYPLEIEKNGTTHKKTPIYFIERYPKYEEWFLKRFKSRDEYVKKVFDMQKGSMQRIWKEQRRNLENSIIEYAKEKDKLDVYYSGLQEIFSTSIIGPVFKLFITTKIESIILDDQFRMFVEENSKKEMLEEINTRLGQEIKAKPIEDVVRSEGEIVVARIGENPDYQEAKEAFTGKVKSVEDDDYSIEEALQDIHTQSNLVEDFQEDSPFHQEMERIGEKISHIKQQIKILESAYQSFPRKKKNLKDIVSDIENKKIKKSILPENHPSADNEERD